MKAANIRASAAVAAFVGAIPAVAVAEETSGADILIPKPAEFIPALIIFLIIWFLLAKLAWPKVLSMLDTREKTIQASIDEANETKEKASEIRDQADAVIADARRQASEIVLAASAQMTRCVAPKRTLRTPSRRSLSPWPHVSSATRSPTMKPSSARSSRSTSRK